MALASVLLKSTTLGRRLSDRKIRNPLATGWPVQGEGGKLASRNNAECSKGRIVELAHRLPPF
jgi:hypothetical protein